MLVRFYGKNFRSLKGPFELSLVAADLTRPDDRDRGVIEAPILGSTEPLRLLRAVGIYGPNASGKSTILLASRALGWLATESSARTKPDAKIPPYEPFLMDKDSSLLPIELGCDVVHNRSILRYEITYTSKLIHKETLTILDAKRTVKLIDRLPSGEVRGSLISRSDANRLYVKEMQPNVSVLSKLAQHGPSKGKESVRPYYQTILNATQYREYAGAAEMHINIDVDNNKRFADDEKYREWIMGNLMTVADVGICDVSVRREPLEFPDFVKDLVKEKGDFQLPDKRVVVSFIHQGDSNRTIPFALESSGTMKLFNIADDWWSLANEPITLFADELSASLHPRLLNRIIQVINGASVERRSQLVFATHDTGLLEGVDGQPPALRRDQVYFTKKNQKGATELYSLTEFKEDARPVHNIRKRYLSGLYGAIPYTEELSL